MMTESLLERFERLIEKDQLSHAYLIDGQDRLARRNFIFQIAASSLAEKGRSKEDLIEQMRHNQHINVQIIDASEPEKMKGEILQSKTAGKKAKGQAGKKASTSSKEQKAKKVIGQSIKIEKIRRLVDELSQSSRDGRDRFYILDDAEKLTLNAANSLLKSLEEPNKGNHLFISVDNYEMVLPTIRSRCQWIHLPDVSRKETRKSFEEAGLSTAMAQWVAFQVTRVEDAKNLAKDESYAKKLAAEWKWFSLLGRQPIEAMISVKKYVSDYCDTRMDAYNYLNDLALLARDALVYPYVSKEELTRIDRIEAYKELVQHSPADYWLKVSESIEQAMKEIKANISTEAVFEGLAVRCQLALKTGKTRSR